MEIVTGEESIMGNYIGKYITKISYIWSWYFKVNIPWNFINVDINVYY